MSARAAMLVFVTAFATAAAAQLPGAPASAHAPAASQAPASAPTGKDARAQPTRYDDKDVIDATQKWLKLIDSGHYGDAWDGAAAPLKTSVTREGFVKGLTDIRKGYGKVASRTPGRFARAHSMPNGPEGDYALVSFDTKFANGKKAEEQVVWLLEAEDSWRVSGYFMR